MNRILPWIVGALVLTLAFGAIYVVAQQVERMGANDEGQRLASQVSPTASTDQGERVDLATSLAPFYVVFDELGKPLFGTGYLDGALAEPPRGVIDIAVSSGSNAVTWQPRPGLRFATVEVHVGNRVVMGAQSLSPSEKRTDTLGLLVLLGWAACLVVLGLGALLTYRIAQIREWRS
jgi:hypothetical protein